MKITYYQVMVNGKSFSCHIDFTLAKLEADDLARSYHKNVEVIMKSTNSNTKLGKRLSLIALRDGGF